jgi:hypothetical protein
MATASRLDVVDVLSALLQREQANIFHFATESDPYVNRAAAELRRPLREMVASTLRREGELIALLAELGTTPRPPRLDSETQYLAYLSVDFLVPKLIEAKQHSVALYEQTLAAVGAADPMIAELLNAHLAEHRGELSVLKGFVSSVTQSGRAGAQHPSPAFDPKKN